ncbi:hypothetical protein Poly30_37210 [Planctomycetes bacterium Poly30]|uniref:Outer membrane protein beta-barrel domain-containing protein n=1 Tax=Saltatorellus ferox TaxID=2528018 RepID=A0A518EVR9_9BACT|nr:hypothetical protein Poly30_37210 [Planctomycetes bacterium Poly30]
MRFAIALLLLASTALLGACSAPTAKVMPFLGSIGLDGDLAIADTSSMTRTTSTFSELGITDDEATLGGIVRLGLGGAELSLAGLSLDYSGSGTTNGEFTLDGQTIGADVDVDTAIQLQMARGLFTWDVIPIGGVDLGFGIGATLIDLSFDLREQNGLASIMTDQLIPIPLIGARAAWTWGPVDLRADVGGLIVEYDGDEAKVLDGEVSAAVEFLGVGDLVVGYRITKIDAAYEDADSRIDANFALEGYYFGLQFGF